MSMKELLERLEGVRSTNDGEYIATCPAHSDKFRSLMITERVSKKDGKERLLLCCHAACRTDEILARLGITAKDLIVNP